MSALHCSSCGEFVLRPERVWTVVEPDPQYRAERICNECLQTFDAVLPLLFVYRNQRLHRATVLSEGGIRLARQDLGLIPDRVTVPREYLPAHPKAA
jgi:hypothetical protein